ncbi:MAG: efflux RND transporter periplasmic adaptor subunit [Gammaproteobacteria bacterium]
MKRAFKYTLLAAAALVGVAGLAVPKIFNGTAPATAKQTHEGTRPPAAAAAVSVETVVPAPLVETIASTGTLRADEGVELQAETNGRIVAISFTEGAHVQKGDLLVKLNDADLVATRARGVYRKELALLKERRFAQLLKQGVARAEEYDTALNDLHVQEAEIALTDAQIAKTEVRAPFDGVVGLRYVSEGAYVTAATRVATLQRLDRLKVDFSVPEKYVTRLRVGSPIQLTVAGVDRRFAGAIYAIDPRIDSATRTVLIRAACPNKEAKLFPGAFASVSLTLGEIDNAVLVPAIAVVPGLNAKTVFVVEDGKAQLRTVVTGTRLEDRVQILDGLKAGEVVVTSGVLQLSPGQRVRSLATEQSAGGT